MYLIPPSIPMAPVPDNPTDEQRHEMMRESLNRVDRPEDYEDILRLISPPPDATRYANPGEFNGWMQGA